MYIINIWNHTLYFQETYHKYIQPYLLNYSYHAICLHLDAILINIIQNAFVKLNTEKNVSSIRNKMNK